LIICPACGSKVEGQLCLGCPSCGARAVGPPLARPEHQLVSYGPAVTAIVGGGLMLSGFLTSTVVAWVTTRGAILAFWAITSAGEVAAWRLKWISIPVTVGAVWGGSRLLRSIRNDPATFGGLRVARAGYSMALVTVLLIATLIGTTVPERLRRRQWGLQAAEYARAYTLSRALLQYRDLHGTLPPQEDLVQQLRTLPDPDGSIAEALRFVDAKGYEATSVLAAAAPKAKPLPRGAALRNASLKTAPDPPGLSFTNYELRMPGEDKKLNTEDDLIIHDGLVMTVPEFLSYRSARSSAR
jgi:hypothetical protein